MKTWQQIYNEMDAVIRAKCKAPLPPADLLIGGISQDTRTLRRGDLFIALSGTQAQGVAYVQEALDKGAVGVLCPAEDLHADGLSSSLLSSDLPCWGVLDLPLVLGHLAASYYDHPTRHLRVVGITGTNGKTTIATLLAGTLRTLGIKTGYLTSVAYDTGDEVFAATHTTPDPIALQAYMSRMYAAGCTHATMEVSSHGIDQQRMVGVEFTGGIFTNITHDHLDYHGDFATYIGVKKRFFDALPSTAFALVNGDDRNGEVMLQNTAARRYTYGLRHAADYAARVVEDAPTGLALEVWGRAVSLQLSGYFNAYNALAIVACADLLGVAREEALRALSAQQGVAGRFEWVANDRGVHVVIDYAHTPDGLGQVLRSLSRWAQQTRSRVLCVVGCGGNRDKTKRPQMGAVVCSYSDDAFFTSDNPRDEDPMEIIADMQRTLTEVQRRRVTAMADRTRALEAALAAAKPNDFVLVAGKGCETHQEIAGKHLPYSDKVVLEKLLHR